MIQQTWDDTNRTVISIDDETGDVVDERPYDDNENENADNLAAQETEEAQRVSLREQLAGGVADVQKAKDDAQADIAAADNLLAQANTLVGQIDARIAAITAWTPGTTYKQSDLVAVKNEILSILQRQKDITNAIGGIYSYRKSVDQNAVLTDNSLLWLARLASNDLGV